MPFPEMQHYTLAIGIVAIYWEILRVIDSHYEILRRTKMRTARQLV